MDALQVGSSIFYRGDRYWVETAGDRFIRVADCMIRPESPAPLARHSFYVPVGAVSEAPVSRNKYGRQPTKAAVDRRERQKSDQVRDNGDEVAVLLRVCGTIDAVYVAASKYLGVPESELRSKYAHLNPGQQRMNCGNRMRALFKKKGGAS